jgi:3-oxoacyl-[acyl-carrier protein] reductase
VAQDSIQDRPFGGKVALVTGASGSIGGAIARRLGAGGAHVACHYRSREPAARATLDALRAAGGDGLLVCGDVTSGEDVNALVQQTLDASGGRIDILVNTAGTLRDKLLLRMEEEDWDTVITTNLRSAYLVSRAVLRPMVRQRWGRIVNISSVVGRTGNAGQTNYSAAKAGLFGFTMALAREVATRGITVNAVAPGFIDDGLTSHLGDDIRQWFLDRIPMGRFGAPEEVAALCVFLCREDAGYVTGQILNVDGGLAMG